jgi:hypothetical protein
VRYA